MLPRSAAMAAVRPRIPRGAGLRDVASAHSRAAASTGSGLPHDGRKPCVPGLVLHRRPILARGRDACQGARGRPFSRRGGRLKDQRRRRAGVCRCVRGWGGVPLGESRPGSRRRAAQATWSAPWRALPAREGDDSGQGLRGASDGPQARRHREFELPPGAVVVAWRGLPGQPVPIAAGASTALSARTDATRPKAPMAAISRAGSHSPHVPWQPQGMRAGAPWSHAAFSAGDTPKPTPFLACPSGCIRWGRGCRSGR